MKKTSYHHDDLRAALLEAARVFVEAYGHDGLSVRGLALAAGVSPGAPYHHFRDRRSLLVALALEGFQRLNGKAAAVLDGCQPAGGKLLALGANLLDFCTEHPKLFDLMYDSEITRPTIEPALAAGQRNGFDLVTRAFRDAAPALDQGELRARAMSFWATLYGYAALTGRGLLQSYVLADTPYALVREVIVRQAVGDLLGTNTINSL